MKRYNYRTDNPWFGNGFVQHSEGEWVKHKDVESMGIAFADCIAENARLKDQIERLRQCGDLLAFHYESLGRKFFPTDPLPSSINAWKAAKEGKLP